MSRVRDESVGEQSAKTKDMERSFPSTKVGSDQFLRMASWRETVPTQPSPTPTASSDIAGKVRSWYGNLSRRTLFISLIVLLAMLFIIAIIITVVVVFVIDGDHHDHAFTAIVFTMSTSSPPTPTPFPFPIGYVVGTLFRYVPLGVVDSLVPDTRAFSFQQQLLSYGNGSLSLLRNSSISTTSAQLNTMNCTSCTVLAADDGCFSTMDDDCDQSQTIYCCTNCSFAISFCRVKGVLYEFTDQLVETRVLSDANGLQLTTASHINSSSCAVQIHRVIADGTIFSGSIQSCQAPQSESDPSRAKSAYLSSTTLNPDSATSPDILTVIDVDGDVQLINVSSDAALAYLPMKIKDSVMSITSTVQEGHLLVAILQESRFYALRYTFSTTCVAVLDNYYQTFLFPGELRNFAWAEDELMLWYVDRSGVNIVQFQFQWEDSC